MRIFSKIIQFFVLSSILISCAEHGGPFNKQQVGGLLGGVGGAILGSNVGKGHGNIAAIAIGTLAGAAIGSSLGSSMDKVDHQQMVRTSQTTLERSSDGNSMSWNNPNTNNSGTITPIKTYQLSDGSYCREFTQQIKVGGKTENGYGKACRQPDGSWKISEYNS